MRHRNILVPPKKKYVSELEDFQVWCKRKEVRKNFIPFTNVCKWGTKCEVKLFVVSTQLSQVVQTMCADFPSCRKERKEEFSNVLPGCLGLIGFPAGQVSF